MNHENQNIEYKRQWQDDVLKSICAFANSAGGELANTTVLFGKQPSKFFSGIEKIRNAVQAEGLSAHTITTPWILHSWLPFFFNIKILTYKI